MTNRILRCCGNPSVLKISYLTGSEYLVCSDCIQKSYWQNGIKEKKDFS